MCGRSGSDVYVLLMYMRGSFMNNEQQGCDHRHQNVRQRRLTVVCSSVQYHRVG